MHRSLAACLEQLLEGTQELIQILSDRDATAGKGTLSDALPFCLLHYVVATRGLPSPYALGVAGTRRLRRHGVVSELTVAPV